jgi:hypoxanthine-guanine phosphoribosyltransferase
MTAPLKPEILLTNEEIKKEVARLAQEISRDYQGKQPLLLGILKGSFVFMVDLVRLLEIPIPIDYRGFTVPDRFVVGYGLDYDERFRHLPHLCVVEDCSEYSYTIDWRGKR